MQDKPIDISSLLDENFKENDLSILKVSFVTLSFYLSHYLVPFLFMILAIPLTVPLLVNNKVISYSQNQPQAMILQLSSISALVGDLFAAVAVILISKKLFKNLKDNKHNAAGWNLCKASHITKGALTGILLASTLIFTQNNFAGHGISNGLATIRNIWGFQFGVLLLILRILISTPIEELLFRGILLGILNKKFGLFYGALISTILFILIHLPINGWWEIFTYSVVSICAVYLRYRSKSVSPCIAFHLVYNIFIVFALF